MVLRDPKANPETFRLLLPKSPLSTALLPNILLLRLGAKVHGLQVIGADVPVSPESRQRQEGRGRDRRTDLRRQAIERDFRVDLGASREEAPEEMIFLSCDAAPGVLRNQGEQSGTRERS